MSGDDETWAPEPVEIPIDGELDLHTFDPSDLGDLLPDYLEACREAGILEVRVVHGKGTGALRRSVHAILARLDYVDRWHTDDAMRGGWGATVVVLQPRSTDTRR